MLRLEGASLRRSEALRLLLFKGLEGLGICMDQEKNATRSGDERDISTADSKVKILVIPTNEELQIALTAQEVLAKSKS